MTEERTVHPLKNLAAPHVLGLLDPPEAAAFEAHLQYGCATCQAEVAALREVSGALGRSGGLTRPPHLLRERVLGRVRADAASRSSTLVVPASAGAWETAGPGVTVKYLFCDPVRSRRTMLMRVSASTLVYSMALRVLRDPSSASEVVVDIFARLAQRASTYDPGRGSPTTWLVMQARTRAIDRYRLDAKTRSREVSLTAEMENEIPSLTEDSAEVSARGEVQRSIRAALALLTVPQRRVIEIAFYSGLSQSQIAALLGEPLGTVKTRIRTAMRRLRELLAPSLEQLRP